MANIDSLNLVDLIGRVTDVEFSGGQDNVLLQMEICDRIKASHKECKLACELMLKNLKVKNFRKIKLTLELIEICSKNGNLQFHKLLSGKEFSDQFLLILKKKRTKGGVLKKIESKQNRLIREQTEDQLLYLIQLWADTFMMKEDHFPGFQLTYRQLRKEGVSFPMRDPNVRMLMSSLGVDSPMFDFVEQISGRPTSLSMPPQQQRSKQRQDLEKQQKNLQEKDAIEEVERMEFEDNEDDYQLARSKVDPSEYEIIKSSLQLLEDIQNTAESLDELKSEVATDIYQTCLMMRRRVARIVQAKSFTNTDIESVAELLDIIDYIDKKLESYKKKYLKYKSKKLREIEKKKQKIQQEESKSDDEDDDKKKKKAKKNKREKKVKQNQNTDLLDLGGGQQLQLDESEGSESEGSEEEKNQKEEQKKETGFKKLAAPPTSKSHVISNLQKLKEKLQKDQNLEPAASQKNEDKETNNVMDMLIDLDIKSDPQSIQPQQNQFKLASGLDDLFSIVPTTTQGLNMTPGMNQQQTPTPGFVPMYHQSNLQKQYQAQVIGNPVLNQMLQKQQQNQFQNPQLQQQLPLYNNQQLNQNIPPQNNVFIQQQAQQIEMIKSQPNSNQQIVNNSTGQANGGGNDEDFFANLAHR
ncbi:tom1-like protein 2-like [Stylonychia lemnae]|uniref:Tom1-like protein 2-like n=1 Tax=Stylonychia lemnae TaxID=5949 RepID=A0A078AU11_STYLE|nr:tom1-like protein 2-like [Stylonychia lemnae]|eukprot:CDW84727.1 tom1-like protein 2-like [Stylonychia lemnae]